MPKILVILGCRRKWRATSDCFMSGGAIELLNFNKQQKDDKRTKAQ